MQWAHEAEVGICYREQGIVCAEGTCGHCDGARVKEQKMDYKIYGVTAKNAAHKAALIAERIKEPHTIHYIGEYWARVDIEDAELAIGFDFIEATAITEVEEA